MAETIPVRPRRGGRARTQAATIPRAPGHLSKESRKLFDSIVTQWVLGPDGLAILRAALESRDQYEICSAQVAKDGPTFRTETGQIRAHPAAKLSIDYLSAFRQAMRQLGLQPEE